MASSDKTNGSHRPAQLTVRIAARGCRFFSVCLGCRHAMRLRLLRQRWRRPYVIAHPGDLCVLHLFRQSVQLRNSWQATLPPAPDKCLIAAVIAATDAATFLTPQCACNRKGSGFNSASSKCSHLLSCSARFLLSIITTVRDSALLSFKERAKSDSGNSWQCCCCFCCNFCSAAFDGS